MTDEVFKEDEDKTTRQKTAPRQNRSNPVCSSNQQAAMTVESVGLPPAGNLQLLQVCFRFTISYVRKIFKDVHRNSSTCTESHGRGRWGQGSGVRVGGGHSGCTCERLQDHFQQTVHTDHDNCTDSAQSMQGGGEGGGQQIVSLSTSQKRGWGCTMRV